MRNHFRLASEDAALLIDALAYRASSNARAKALHRRLRQHHERLTTLETQRWRHDHTERERAIDYDSNANDV